ncbi:hypothetical protein U27_03981 [Candidatus Vecturithrix granuli]|uniref:Glycosyltransferase 2-like domain-containing protein n=1 Tax=Vecturithrix granuli TaxID=1499967 RepID=A0A081BXG2_VECG1|nr:hypothetical protein U27_03981 [Candidatus Vecturithrix granuli]
MNSPIISVILPRRSQDSAEQAIQAILQCDYPQAQLEILEVIGENPSQQRNRAAAAAKGELLYFLDNDSLVTPDLFSRIVQYYQEKDDLAGVGGPNLTPETDSFLQKSFGYALASPFAHFKMAARYTSTGKVRETDEKELILCNLSVRRDIFLQEHGLNESLYPNEENEFINRLLRKGYRFLYDPEAVVYRSRRTRIRDFIKQFLRYGRGRVEQMQVEGFSWKSLLFLAPLGLLGYLAGCIGLSLVMILPWWVFLPIWLYGGFALFAAFQSALQAKEFWPALLLPLWSFAMHLAYGAGLVVGFWQSCAPAIHSTFSRK